MATSVEIRWHGLILELCSEKAIYLPGSKTLLVADTHFGKAATFRQAGIPVPESSSRDDCIRIEKLIERTNAQSLVFLGDFLHARAGRTDSVRAELFDWRQRVSRIDLHLVRGNHDLQSGDPWPELESNVTKTHGNNMVSNFVISRSKGQLIPISPDTCIPDSRSRGKAGGVSVHLAFKWEKTESSFLHSELLRGLASLRPEGKKGFS